MQKDRTQLFGMLEKYSRQVAYWWRIENYFVMIQGYRSNYIRWLDPFQEYRLPLDRDDQLNPFEDYLSARYKEIKG